MFSKGVVRNVLISNAQDGQPLALGQCGCLQFGRSIAVVHEAEVSWPGDRHEAQHDILSKDLGRNDFTIQHRRLATVCSIRCLKGDTQPYPVEFLPGKIIETSWLKRG